MAMRRYHDFVLLTDDPEIGDDGKLAALSVRVFQSPAGEGDPLLALTALPPVPKAGLERIMRAVDSLKGPWKRYRRRVELRGALADAEGWVHTHQRRHHGL